MYNLFKNILPALKARIFGKYISAISPTETPPLKIYCRTLYIMDEFNNDMLSSNIVDEIEIELSIIDYEEDLEIIDLEETLNLLDAISWEINDGC